jgi:hypothetical protein
MENRGLSEALNQKSALLLTLTFLLSGVSVTLLTQQGFHSNPW